MPKVRINDLARELEVKGRLILEVLTLVGVTEKKTHSSSLEEWEAEKVRAHIRAASSAPDYASPAVAHITNPGEILRRVTQETARGAGERSPVAASVLLPDVGAGPPFLTPNRGTEAAGVLQGAPVLDASPNLDLPDGFSFYTPGFVHFDHVLQHFDWDLRKRSLTIDLSRCTRSNYQCLALLLQYAWYLTLNACSVTFKYGTAQSGSTKMLTSMGALDWRNVLLIDGRDFTNAPGKNDTKLQHRVP